MLKADPSTGASSTGFICILIPRVYHTIQAIHKSFSYPLSLLDHPTYSASSIYRSISKNQTKPSIASLTKPIQRDANGSGANDPSSSKTTEDVYRFLSNPTVTRVSAICPLLQPILTVPEEDYLAERQLESEEMEAVRSTVVLPKKASCAPSFSPTTTYLFSWTLIS